MQQPDLIVVDEASETPEAMFAMKDVEKFTTEEAWKGRRKKCVGASEVAVLFGCHPYMTPNFLYHLKRGKAVDDRRNDKGLRNFGTVMEPIIAQLVADKTNWTLDNLALQEHHLMPGNHQLGCTVDRFIIESERGPGILEIKNVSAFSPGWTETRAPDYVEYQMQQQLMIEGEIRGVKWGCIGAMIGGNPDDIRIFVRTPDKKVQKAITERTAKFWKAVEEGREPDVMADDYEHVVDMFKAAEERREEDVKIAADVAENMEQLIMNYEAARLTRLEAENDEKEAKAKLLRAAMIDKPEGMQRDLVLRGTEVTAEFKVTETKERTTFYKAGMQLRINIKENAQGDNG